MCAASRYEKSVVIGIPQGLVDFLSAMIEDYEQKYGVVVDRSELDGEIVVPPHLRRISGGGWNNRMSSGILGSLTRSRTLIQMGGGNGGGGSMVHGSVPDLSRNSVSSSSGISSMGTSGLMTMNSGRGSIATPLLEESSDYKLKEGSGGGGSDLDVESIKLRNDQKITKSLGKKLYAAKSTNYLLGDDGGEVQLRRNSEDYYPRGEPGEQGDGFEDGGQPSQLMKSFQSRSSTLDRSGWNAGLLPPPPPSRASSTALLHNHQQHSGNNTHSHFHNHFHYDPTQYQSHLTSSHLSNNNNNNNIKYNNRATEVSSGTKSGSTNIASSIMSVNNKSSSGQSSSTPANTTTHHSTTNQTPIRNTPGSPAAPPGGSGGSSSSSTSSSRYSPNVRRWDEGRSSLSRRPTTFMQGLTNRSASTTSLVSVGKGAAPPPSDSLKRPTGGKMTARAKHQLELQKMKEFNSYAAIGSLDRKRMSQKANRQKSVVANEPMTMTLDRPRAHVNKPGGGDGISSEVVAIRTSMAVGEMSYKIPRPVMDRSLSEQEKQRRNDMGIEIVDMGGRGEKIVLRTFGGSDAQVMFCESSSDGELVSVEFVNDDDNDDGEDDSPEGEERRRQRRRRRSWGVNDSAA